MDFFTHQDRARKLSRWLLLLYAVAVLAVVASIDLLVGATLRWWLDVQLPARTHLLIMLSLAAVIVAISVHRLWTLRDDEGEAVALMSNAQRVAHTSAEFSERRLINVVEEMALASGMRVPDVYVVEAPGINAFAAGSSVNKASVFVTRGALTLLKRSELQGVIGHEFSHILNGDMLLNMRLLGYLAGIQFFGAVGAYMVRSAVESTASSQKRSFLTRRVTYNARGYLPFLAFGAMLWAIGAIGMLAARLIQAALSRQREFLADAASVQFTRDAGAIGGALQKIGSYGLGSALRFRYASELSHMFMADALPREHSPLATHPPIAERLRRLGQPQLPRQPALDIKTLSPTQIRAGVAALVQSELQEEFASAATKQDAATSAPDASTRTGIDMSSATVHMLVGNPRAEHLANAHSMLTRLPAALLEQINRIDGAEAALCALFLSDDPKAVSTQTRALSQLRAGKLVHDSQRYKAELAHLGTLARLPLMDLALPQCRQRTLAERQSLVHNLRALIEADQRTSLDEFVFQTIIEHDLLERNGKLEAIRYDDVQAVRGPASLVAALVAYVGAQAGRSAAQSYQRAEALYRWLVPMSQREEVTLASIKRALEDLRALAPLQKPLPIRAFVTIAQADARLAARELELLRAIASAMDCPIPALKAEADLLSKV